MKITVIQALPALQAGGVERGTIEVASELVRRGHRAIVISAGGQLVQELQEAGCEHIVLPLGRKSPTSLLAIGKLASVIRNSGADIVHARSRLPAWISHLALATLKPAQRPVFVTSVHGPYSVNRYSKIMTRGERVIAISDYIYRYIAANYHDVDMARVVVIPRGISAENFPYGYKPSRDWLRSWQQQQPQLQGKFIITLPARLTRWKGQEDFIDMTAILVQAGINVHGIIAGGVDPGRQYYRRELAALVASRGLEKHITFTGHRNDLRDVMSVSNTVVSLSREPEAFGRTSLEALGLGVPVIAYNHGGAGEVLGRIFPQGLVPALDPAAAANCALDFYRASPRVPDNNPFTLQAMLDGTLSLYQELAAQRGI